MPKISLEFTKKQFETLLELVYLGNWMVNAVRDGSKEDPHFQEHDDLADFIYSKAGEVGGGKLFEYDPEFKKWFPTTEFTEENVDFYHDDYDERIFWEELIDRLSWRDLRALYGEKEIGKMSFQEKIIKRQPFIEKYEEEFDKNWLSGLVIKEQK